MWAVLSKGNGRAQQRLRETALILIGGEGEVGEVVQRLWVGEASGVGGTERALAPGLGSRSRRGLDSLRLR